MNIKEVTFGAERVETDGNVFEFFRMSEKQSELFGKTSESFYKKSFATAGIFLDFYTDATGFSFKFKRELASVTRKWYYLEAMINGRFAKLEGEAEAVKNEGALNIVLDGKLNRVTVFLPNLSKVKLYDAELRDSSRIIPAKKKGKILFYGDSITQGYDAIRPSKSYVNGFCFANDIEPINLGIGGDVFNADNVSEEKLDCDAVVVAYGTNDWKLESREHATHAPAEFFKKLRRVYSDKKIYYLMPIWRKDFSVKTAAGDFLDCRKLFAEQAENAGIDKIIDTIDFIPKDEIYFSDGLHPNDKGFEFYFKALNGMLK